MFGGRFLSSVGVVGVDLGSRAVKMLQVRDTDEGLKVVGAARIDAPPGQQRNWSPTSEQWIAAFSSTGFSGRRCVVCLPRSDVHVQAVQLPKMPDRDLRQAIIWEASHRFGLDRDALEVDAIPTGAVGHGTENREETLLIAASRDVINNRLEPLLAAGLRPLAIDVDFAANARAISNPLRREADQLQVQAVVEIGASGSSVMILRGRDICFYKQMSISGAMLNQAVAEHLQVDGQAAAELRMARIASSAGGADAKPLDGATDRAVFEAVRPCLNELVKETVLCLRYYGVTFRGHPPESILLSGGDGMEPMLSRLLQDGCNIPVGRDDERGTQATMGRQIQASLNRAPGPPSSWTTAVGLSLRGLASCSGSGRSEPSVREAA